LKFLDPLIEEPPHKCAEGEITKISQVLNKPVGPRLKIGQILSFKPFEEWSGALPCCVEEALV
jgi:hypothetical protein